MHLLSAQTELLTHVLRVLKRDVQASKLQSVKQENLMQALKQETGRAKMEEKYKTELEKLREKEAEQQEAKKWTEFRLSAPLTPDEWDELTLSQVARYMDGKRALVKAWEHDYMMGNSFIVGEFWSRQPPTQYEQHINAMEYDLGEICKKKEQYLRQLHGGQTKLSYQKWLDAQGE